MNACLSAFVCICGGVRAHASVFTEIRLNVYAYTWVWA